MSFKIQLKNVPVAMSEFIKDRLYFATIPQNLVPKNDEIFHLFSTDNELVYINFFSDFGPLDFGCLYQYCVMLNNKLENIKKSVKIVYYTKPEFRKRSNAAYLISAYSVLYLGMQPEYAFKTLSQTGNEFRPFQDASPLHDIYTITILDCLNAIKKALAYGFFDFNDFDLEEYKKCQEIRNGDMTWIVPSKFLAFSGPSRCPRTPYKHPQHYFEYFKANTVSTVLRLNEKQYDASEFLSAGFEHFDLYFQDGCTPSKRVMNEFMKIFESAKGAIAVHCKAGLGRTGVLIGSCLVKYYSMSAREAIAWMRICRPGCVIGRQQCWLEINEEELLDAGNSYRLKNFGCNKIYHHEYGIYSIKSKMKKCMYSCGERESLKKMKDGDNIRLKERKIYKEIGKYCLKNKEEEEEEKSNLKKVAKNGRFRGVVKKAHNRGSAIETAGTSGEMRYTVNKKDVGEISQGDQLNSIKASKQLPAKNRVVKCVQ